MELIAKPFLAEVSNFLKYREQTDKALAKYLQELAEFYEQEFEPMSLVPSVDGIVLVKPPYKGDNTSKKEQEAWEEYADAQKNVMFAGWMWDAERKLLHTKDDVNIVKVIKGWGLLGDKFMLQFDKEEQPDRFPDNLDEFICMCARRHFSLLWNLDNKVVKDMLVWES